jgi:hypothetical protein
MTKKEMQRKINNQRRQILKIRRELNILFSGILPKRGSFTHTYLKSAMRLAGTKFKTDSI